MDIRVRALLWACGNGRLCGQEIGREESVEIACDLVMLRCLDFLRLKRSVTLFDRGDDSHSSPIP